MIFMLLLLFMCTFGGRNDVFELLQEQLDVLARVDDVLLVTFELLAELWAVQNGLFVLEVIKFVYLNHFVVSN